MEKFKQIEELIERKKKYLLKFQEKKQTINTINLLKSEINTLSNFLEEINAEFLEHQNEILKLEKKLKKIESIQLKLEAICLIHGVDNLSILMSRPEEVLIQQYKETRLQNFRFFPIAFFDLKY